MKVAPAVHMVLVGAPGCHLCADADTALGQLGDAVHLEHVDATSDRGRTLLAQHRAALLPLVLVDGAFFSHGRLPRNKLRALMQHHRTDVA